VASRVNTKALRAAAKARDETVVRAAAKLRTARSYALTAARMIRIRLLGE
jgi:hypothetical protein